MRMKMLQQKKAKIKLPNPINCNIIRFNLGMLVVCVWSNTIKPHPPRTNMKAAAKPSIIYCLFESRHVH